MMFRTLSLLILCICVIWASALPVETQRADETKKVFSFDDALSGNTFSMGGFNGTWISGNEYVYRNNDSVYVRFNVEAMTRNTFFEADILNQWANPSWTLSPDNTKLLIRHNVTQIFRHSIIASYAIYDITTKLVIDIADKALLSVCIWSPNSEHIVYVKDNDVYFVRQLVSTVRLTNDGVVGVIYNGVPDWVYEEEVFSSGGAMWVAPNGARLVIASFDDTDVEEFTYILYNDQYETDVKLRYPKVGRKNPIVTLKHIDLNDQSLEWKVVGAPIEIVSEDHILKSVSWLDDGTFGSIWMNRRQNQSVFQQCNALSNTCREVFQTQEPNGWIEMSAMRCTPNGERCFYIDYVGNWANIYEFIVATGERREFIVDSFTVKSIYGYNADKDEIYYLATAKNRPEERHVYRNRECLSCQMRDSDNVPCTYASAAFSKDFTYYSFSCLGPTIQYTSMRRSTDNALVVDWRSNDDTRQLVKTYDMPNIHFLTVPLSSGFNATVKLIVPSEIDLFNATAAKAYPMVVDVYAGPNSDRVSAAFSLGYKQFLITSRKVIYCQIDGRGSGNSGKSMLFTVNNKLGTVEIADQIEVTRYLQDKYAAIDRNRTAIWGWSYGGYATARVLADDKDLVFQCGISVAPVSSWIYYDSIYTERYMGLPTAADNFDNYHSSDISGNLETNALSKHRYMLVHGNADDNVHYQNALIFSNALVKANVDFVQVSYPNEAHGLSGVQRHLYHSIDKFWVNCLNLTSV